MAHRLQLALVTASRGVKDVHQFFDHLVNIINIVVGSSSIMMNCNMFKQKTAYEIGHCDWSSDVCSSDLEPYNVHNKHMGNL